MPSAAEYLDLLRLPFQKSVLTAKDIAEIEGRLNYSFPEPYKDFLMTYKLPKKCVFIHNADELDEKSEEASLNSEVIWINPAGDTVEEFLQNASDEDDYISDDFSALDAGFLKIAEIDGYYMYIDLVTGAIVRLYHEELWEMTVVEGVDGSDKEEIRDYMLDGEEYHDFYDYLDAMCTTITGDSWRYLDGESDEYVFRQEAVGYIESMISIKGMTRDEAIMDYANSQGISVEQLRGKLGLRNH